MTPVQMNVRIDRDLKSAGDAAFEDIGYTPTEVVREVWGFAKRNRRNQRALRDLMRSLRDPRKVAAEQQEQAQRDAELEKWLVRGPNVVRDVCAQYGIDIGILPSIFPEEYDELLVDGLMEDYERIARGE